MTMSAGFKTEKKTSFLMTISYEYFSQRRKYCYELRMVFMAPWVISVILKFSTAVASDIMHHPDFFRVYQQRS